MSTVKFPAFQHLKAKPRFSCSRDDITRHVFEIQTDTTNLQVNRLTDEPKNLHTDSTFDQISETPKKRVCPNQYLLMELFNLEILLLFPRTRKKRDQPSLPAIYCSSSFHSLDRVTVCEFAVSHVFVCCC